MCKHEIVIIVIARKDVDGHFGTTLNLIAGLFWLPVYSTEYNV